MCSRRVRRSVTQIRRFRVIDWIRIFRGIANARHGRRRYWKRIFRVVGSPIFGNGVQQPVRAHRCNGRSLHGIEHLHLRSRPAGLLVGADYQVYPVMGIGPRVYVHPTLATVIASEVPAGTTFSVAMVGAAARTLLSVGNGFRCVVAGTGSGSISTYGIAMLWE